MNFVEFVRYVTLINGFPHEEFIPKRGLRQGDSLSPYFFLLCLEGLSAIINTEESLKNFKGLYINNFCPTLTHLFFVDDSLLFFKAEEKD